MRHLLLPTAYNNPPRMTRADQRRARARGAARYLHAILLDCCQAWFGTWRYDPALLGIVLAFLVFPPSMPEPASTLPQPQVAWIAIAIQIGIMIVSTIIAASMQGKVPVPKPAALSDFDVPTATEGRPVPKIFGEWIIKDPNVLNYFDLSYTAIKKKAGGK